jgi:tripartite-type tricarboxylate transporter receptor subunit TctC
MRTSLRALCLAVALGGLAITAQAADYPVKPIRFIVGFLPGAATDYSARVVAEALTSRLGQPVVVENRPGAGSMIAAEVVSKATPDGYTLMMGNSDGITVLPAVNPTVPYHAPEDFSYISRFIKSPVVLVSSPKLPVKSMAELIAYAKANPGKLKYGTSGVGGIPHLTTLLLDQQAGIKMTHVPYKGTSGALTDIISGQIDVGFLTLSTVGAAAKAGQVLLLAVTSEQRQPDWPDLPTMAESGYPGCTVEVWYGMIGPAGLPAPVLDRLRGAVGDALASPEVKARLAASGLAPAPLIGDDFRKFVADEARRWKAIAKDANISITDQ